MHENYDSYTVENDICLLELGEKVTMGEHVGIIALPDPMEEYEAGTMCTVTGWGALSEGGSLGDTLQKVDVPIVSDEDCRAAYGEADVADSMVCAGFDQGGKDSCQVMPKKTAEALVMCACGVELQDREREPVQATALGSLPFLAAALCPERVLTCPNPKIYTNLSLSCNSPRQVHVTSLGNCLNKSI